MNHFKTPLIPQTLILFDFALDEPCDTRNPNLCTHLLLGLALLDHLIIHHSILIQLKSFSTIIHQSNIHFIHGTSSWFGLESSTSMHWFPPWIWPIIIPQDIKAYFPSRYDHFIWASNIHIGSLKFKKTQNHIFRACWLIMFWQVWPIIWPKPINFFTFQPFRNILWSKCPNLIPLQIYFKSQDLIHWAMTSNFGLVKMPSQA